MTPFEAHATLVILILVGTPWLVYLWLRPRVPSNREQAVERIACDVCGAVLGRAVVPSDGVGRRWYNTGEDTWRCEPCYLAGYADAATSREA